MLELCHQCQQNTNVIFSLFVSISVSYALHQLSLLSFLLAGPPVQNWEDSHIAVAVKGEGIGEKNPKVRLEKIMLSQLNVNSPGEFPGF